MVTHPHIKATILRKPLLGDIELRHQLQAQRQRWLPALAFRSGTLDFWTQVKLMAMPVGTLALVGIGQMSRMTRAALPLIPRDAGATIINIGSLASRTAYPGSSAYCAAKAGIAGMVLTMARDLGGLGIRAVAIAPSLFSTGITEGIPDEFAAALTDSVAEASGRRGERVAYGTVD